MAKKPKTPPMKTIPVEDLEDSSEDDDEAGGVDEAGMKRMMELLGEDGIDEFDAAQLEALAGPSSSVPGSDLENNEKDEEASDSDSDSNSAGEDEEDSVSGEEDDDETEDDNEEDEENEESNLKADGEPEEDVALDDVEDASVDEDVVPKQKVVINNTTALQRIRETIKLDASFSWVETLSVTYPDPLNVIDPDNDLERELAFYKQALYSANHARKLASTSKPPLAFTRPSDYFAEMVKSDAHMERVRMKLLDEKASISKSEDARRQRELKKVGKQVQVEKMKERVKGKKEMEERLKGLKRKRGGAGLENDDEAFDIAVEDAISDKPRSGPSSKRAKGTDGKPRMPRSARNSKFGFGGGGKRREKQNTRESTNDFSSGPGRKGGKAGGKGGKSQRPGKARRQAVRH